MSDGNLDLAAEHRALAQAVDLTTFSPAQPDLFQNDVMWPYFERLRKESPVHFTPESDHGPYWSVTKYNDIMAVDTNHQVFSSEGGITIFEQIGGEGPLPMFIAMDPPKHDIQRKTVTPAVSPTNLALLEPLIRERAGAILDSLPIGETFDWVDKVSMELTAMTLATLFGVDQADRRKLTYWSDVVTAAPGHGLIDTPEQKMQIFVEYHAYFTELWNQRVNAEPTGDLISMLAHGEATRDMSPREYFGNVVLLTVGGNDTTRNTITGSVYALNKNPDQYAKLRANPELIPSMVSETIRWQTPLAHMRRRALADYELGGKQIRKGDKVVMWYVSGNRDDEVIENPDAYIIDRPRPRQHLSFGFGIHRCVGNRLAELQLRVIWEEILKRFPEIVVVSEPKRVFSTFVKGYESMQVMIPRRL
ncbi:MAG: cytochrome P450 [Phenylobacterium sp.]|uniref:cytochrome P450 n=3 Tax=Phenylobacterium sp. TaxID=1871053 RepID=UPI0025D2F67B|nr:cytochrome P450 [Phenylobacterium sp.]MCA6225768.1 cytochrome P450 [Phenylobacterium sp.]MCA6235195.1 cytochrome P450 [Phenylobacterium sp.]MCA6248009.1 cytochrome P450 [Phenylobacterium sp.]MCA6250712.1 cytochrome P450 [Phenylobacterium sp.]MCA6256818.1 cytochrome P450 [Phenylobacterium sp.]